MKKITSSPIFWIIQIILFLFCSYYAEQNYKKAFPIIPFKTQMNRLDALKSASLLAEKHHWGPAHYQKTATFETDETTQTFIEWSTTGNSDAFSKIIQNNLYFPYLWKVRFFSEYQSNETYIYFTPAGSFYGFYEKLPENQPGAALDSDTALQLVEKLIKFEWKIPMEDFQLIEKTKKTQPSERVDHEFIYERTHHSIETDKIKEKGHYRLGFTLSGDRLTEIRHYIKIPEEFFRKYGETRSYNDTAAQIARAMILIVYILIGCGIGILKLAQQRALIWKAPLLCAGVIFIFSFLEKINQIPLMWMNYNTSLSASGFLLNYILQAIINGCADFLIVSISLIAAESLSRKAFPQHPQFWKIWSRPQASSLTILGQTLGGYLSVGFFFYFVVWVYFIGTRSFGWWIPSSTLFEPNGLATFFPWLTAIAHSMHAGIWEEALFRAVPIAGAALLGNYFKKRTPWIIMGFLLQAIIFGAAHADYPVEPYYARMVELIVPSLLFGTLYLLFGLLPGIILHFTFDVIQFALPLFTTESAGIWLDRALVIFLSLAPLWVCFIARLRTGIWFTKLEDTARNGAWTPPPLLKSTPVPTGPMLLQSTPSLWKQISYWIGITLGVFCLGKTFLEIRSSQFHQNFPWLTLNKTEAIQKAHLALEEKKISLTQDWIPLAYTRDFFSKTTHQFIWETETPTLYYQLLGSYLTPPEWIVRFVRFEAPVTERIEEYQVSLKQNGSVYFIHHIVPESQKGTSIELDAAKNLASKALTTLFQLDSQSLKEMHHQPRQNSNRRDWAFIYQNPKISLKTGKAQISLLFAGDELSYYEQSIFIPEDWKRQENNRMNFFAHFHMSAGFFWILFIIFSIGFILKDYLQKQYSHREFLKLFLWIYAFDFIMICNQLPQSFGYLSTLEPKTHQLFFIIGYEIIKVLFFSLFKALICLYIKNNIQFLEKQKTHWLENSFGFFIGFLSYFIFNFIQKNSPHALPEITQYISRLNCYFPWLAIFNPVSLFFFYAIFACFIILKLNQLHLKKIVLYPILILLCWTFLATTTHSLDIWIKTSLIESFLLIVLYAMFLQKNLKIILYFVFGLFSFEYTRFILISIVTHHNSWLTYSLSLAVLKWFTFYLEKRLIRPSASIRSKVNTMA